MEIFKEISNTLGCGTIRILATNDEINQAKDQYNKTGKCDHHLFIIDCIGKDPGWCIKTCAICGHTEII